MHSTLSFALKFIPFLFKAIAVHPDIVYSVLRRAVENDEDAVDLPLKVGERPLMIVAKDRVQALASIIGTADTIAEIPGKADPTKSVCCMC
jgi:hypothetical protein